MVFVFDLHLTTYQSNYWCPIKLTKLHPHTLHTRQRGYVAVPKVATWWVKSQMGFMESGHFKCAFEGNPEPINFGWNLALTTKKLSTCTNCCLPQIEASVVPGFQVHNNCYCHKWEECYLPESTYTKKRQRKRAWPRFQGCKMCFKESRHLTLLLLWGKLAMWAAGAIEDCPNLCFIRGHIAGLLPSEWISKKKKKKKRLPQTSGWYATGIHLPCATYTRDKRGHCTISKVATQGWDCKMCFM